MHSATGLLIILSVSGCFPDPPIDRDALEVAQDTGDTAGDAAGGDADATEDSVPPLDVTDTPPGELDVVDSTGELGPTDVADTHEDVVDTGTRPDTDDTAIETDSEVDSTSVECDGTEDCAHLDEGCTFGWCDAGRCVGRRKDEGAECDDGLKCTVDDVCRAGTCVGEARVCTASDGCHDAGVCDPLTGLCSNPDRPEFAPCDDGDFCTVDDRCRTHRCVAGGPADDGIGDWTALLEADSEVEIHSVLELPDGSINIFGLTRSAAITITGDVTATRTNEVNASFGCSLFRQVINTDGSAGGLTVLGGAVECDADDLLSVSLKPTRLADGSIILGGLYEGGPFMLEGRNLPLGESQSGLSFDSGTWVARLGTDGTFVWTTDLIGAGTSTMGYRGLAASPLGDVWLATAIPSGNALELVYDNGEAELVLDAETGFASGYLVQISSVGRLVMTLLVSIAGTGGALPLGLARAADGTLCVGGGAMGGPLTLAGRTPGVFVTIPTGIASGFEGWSAAYRNADPAWGRHFFSDRGGTVGGAVTSSIAASGTRCIGIGGFVGVAKTRQTAGADQLLVPDDATDPPDVPPSGIGYWFELAPDGSLADAGHFGEDIAFVIDLAADDAGRSVVGAEALATFAPAAEPVVVPVVAQIGSWQRTIAIPSGTPDDLVLTGSQFPPMNVTVSSRGVIASANLRAPALVGLAGQLASQVPSGQAYAAIMRVNSQRGLECE